MNCEKIKDIILTDYLDNHLNSSQELDVRQHLASCQSCREFAADAKKFVLEPFNHVPATPPPAFLWESIKTAIQPQPKKAVSNSLTDHLLRLLALPRSIFALSSICALIFIGLILVQSPHFFSHLKNQQLAKAYLEEQMEYFVAEHGTAQNNYTESPGTDLEEYFV